jgi:hypothetical protein
VVESERWSAIETDGEVIMKTPAMICLRPHQKVVLIVAALLVGGAAGGWAMSTTSASAVESAAAMRKSSMADKELKHNLVGSYVVTGTDADGKPYGGAGIVDVALAPSGALELDWDNGKRVGIGQLIGNVLMVASSTKAGTVIMVMNVNPDGLLSGQWSRRMDRGYKGTEKWKKI